MRYAVSSPIRAKNNSESWPTLFSFDAANDAAAVEVVNQERVKINTIFHNESRLLVPGKTWWHLVVLHQSGTTREIYPWNRLRGRATEAKESTAMTKDRLEYIHCLSRKVEKAYRPGTCPAPPLGQGGSKGSGYIDMRDRSMAQRVEDMAKVRGKMMSLAMQHRSNQGMMRVLPYLALYLTGYKSLEQSPQPVKDMAHLIVA